MDGGDLALIIIGSIIVAVVVFLLCRELMCWYYKINKLVGLMEKQNKLLTQLLIHHGVEVAEESDDSEEEAENGEIDEAEDDDDEDAGEDEEEDE